MNDDTNDNTQNQQNQQNPLDALEELLAQTQASSSGSGGAAGAALGSPAAPGLPQDSQPSEADVEAKAQIEAERLLAEQAQAEKDTQDIMLQRQALEDVKQTPEYQARIQQNQDDQASSEEEAAIQDGYNIVQLDHKKI